MNPALFVKRSFAYFIDLVICIFIYIAFLEVFGEEDGSGRFSFYGFPIVVIFIMLMFIYFAFQEFLWKQTVGKFLLNLEVVKKDKTRLAGVDVCRRHLFDFAELFFLPVLAFLLVLLNKNRRIGDLFAGTEVIERSTEISDPIEV